MVQSVLGGCRRDFGVAHPTVIHRTLQALDRQAEVWAFRKLGGSPRMRQRHLGMGDHQRSVPHPAVVDRLFGVVHGQPDVDSDFEVGQALVDPSGRDLGVTHVSVRDGLLQARYRRHSVGVVIAGRLGVLGGAYGDLPAHDGLWQAAAATADDLGARLAVVPMVLEARGLDVTPGLIAKLETAGDAQGAAMLRVIFEDEIAHVAAGKRWFDFLCARRGLVPGSAWRALVRRHFKGALKPPFNAEARLAAGLQAGFYEPIAPGATGDANSQ